MTGEASNFFFPVALWMKWVLGDYMMMIEMMSRFGLWMTAGYWGVKQRAY